MLFERPAVSEQAIVVHCYHHYDAEDLAELEALVASAGVTAVATISLRRRDPDPKYLIGAGKVAELQAVVQQRNVRLVVFSQPLSPSQERNLEQALQARVVDRTGLILEIFARRAQSFEGKLQVELAQLKHASTRLVRGWTHLERQRGGTGTRGGPGETQLEMDRRMIADRIRQVQQRLDRLARQQHTRRQGRKRSATLTVAVVGYTNAGKSTLFNRLTAAGAYAADQLFATLDTTLRRMVLPNGQTAVLADTVGFIRDLPHELIAAFRSTLQETRDADLLLHVVDAASPNRNAMMAQVEAVLADIGAAEVPTLLVFNKIDGLEAFAPRVDRCADSGIARRVWVSARHGDGIALLRSALIEHLVSGALRRCVHLTAGQAGLRSRLFKVARVCWERSDDTGGWDMEIEILPRDLGLLSTVEGCGAERTALDCAAP